MKLLYTLCGTLLLPLFLTAQQSVTAVSKAAEIRTGPADSRMRTVRSGDRDADDVIWSDDFANPELWIAEGPSDDYDTYGWSIADTTASWFDEIERDMATSGNFARFQNGDPDDFIEDGPFTLTFVDAIDLSGVPVPHLEFDQYGARFITRQEIEVSTDDGITWEQVTANEDIRRLDVGGGSIYGRPESHRYNLTTLIADDPSNVRIRLIWEGLMNGPAMNYIDYGWYVDNVKIVEGLPVDSDIQEVYLRGGVGGFFEFGLDYYTIPLGMDMEIKFAAKTLNQGWDTFIDLHLVAEVSKDEILYTGTSSNIDLLSLATDSLMTTDGYVPDAWFGNYDVTWKFEGAEEDMYFANDSIIKSFLVNQYIYGRDNGVTTDSIQNFDFNLDQSLLIGNVMEMFAEANVYAVDVDLAYVEGLRGKRIFAQIMTYSDELEDWELVGISADHIIVNEEVGATAKIRFDEPIYLGNGKIVLVLVGHYGDREITFRMAQPVDEGTVLGYTEDGLFSLENPSAIMARMDFEYYYRFDNIEEIDASFNIGQNIPNPFNANTRINYSLLEAGKVSIEFVDVTGKLVQSINKGVQNAGDYNVVVDGSNFAEGIYFYTFTVGNEKITKRMVVTK